MSAVELLTRTRGGVLAGTCPPPVPGLEVHCAKSEDPDGTLYDFRLLITIVRNGDLVAITQLVPVANGELLMAMRSIDFRVTIRDRYVKKIETDSLNFGVARIDRADISEYYGHFVQAFFRSRTNIKRFDAAGKLLEERDNMSNYPFPPLPAPEPLLAAGPEPARRFDLDGDPVGRIWFPDFTELDGGDFEVDGGQIVLGDENAALNGATVSNAVKPPGIYIDVLGSDDPPLAITVFKVIGVDGSETTLSATACTRSTSTSMWELIRKKKKRSWFRTRTKVKVIRESLIDVQAGCAPVPL